MNKLLELFDNKEFIYLDGGLGTMLQQTGVELDKVPEVIGITNPNIIKKIHRQYVNAGSDIIYSCTFGVNRFKLSGTGYTVKQIVSEAIANARESVKGTNCKVALDIGPLGRMLEPNGNLTFEDAYEVFKEIVICGNEADLIVIETMTDLYELKAALLAAKENSSLPVICTMSFEENRRTFTGTAISSMALTAEGLGADCIGINCSLGPADFKPLIEELSKWTTLPIAAKANAGMPNPETGDYSIEPKEYAELITELIPYGVKLIGGCCGTTPEYISAMIENFSGKHYEKQTSVIPSAVCSAEETVIIDQPRIIGERINPTGKKLLKEALKSGDMDYVINMAIKEIDEGAEILDVNAGVPGIDEVATIVDIVRHLHGTTTAPLQIDSGNPKAIEAALRVYSGKAIVNSVNGEEKSLNAILPIAKKYGAAIVGLTLDEDGIPKTTEKRIEIAKKIMERAMEIGIPKRDIYIDCLTLTVSAEQANAANTLDAIKIVKEKMGLKTVLGVSNISFGLPNRPIINHNFLQMALTCGLDLPIMNPGSTDMMQAVSVYKLIHNIDKGAKKYIESYSDEISEPKVALKSKSQGQYSEIAHAIMNGLGKQCKDIIRKELETREPVDVINNTLIPVLDLAGREFEKGKIFIPQLMLCATTAQQGFDQVKEKILAGGKSSISLGKIVIATVKGDIHDIGKNIVKVILDNYGFDIVDLGKDVDPEIIVDTVIKEDIKLVGLSALMTTTLPNMEKTIELIKEKNPACKVMVGGAVLTEDYAKKIGADFYVSDAKASADVAKKVFN